ncbi:MAG: hypothetical protein K9L60_10720 [Methylovulum sp.]|nr:hypothetical protein [Methylovulum sp.]MCF8000211.1 hypothetical protein [Methylovulum sp.]
MENPIKAVPENETPDQATERRHQELIAEIKELNENLESVWRTARKIARAIEDNGFNLQ